jgi:hypothetical protein
VVDEVIAQLVELRAIEQEEAKANASHDATDSELALEDGGDAGGDAEPGTNGHRPDLAVADDDLRQPVARSIGVVTPLVAQRDAISDLLLERFGRTITVDTPDTFQGDERDVVIVSLVIGADTRRELVELVADDARLNVALSRARARLVIIGDREVAAASNTRLAEIATGLVG